MHIWFNILKIIFLKFYKIYERNWCSCCKDICFFLNFSFGILKRILCGAGSGICLFSFWLFSATVDIIKNNQKEKRILFSHEPIKVDLKKRNCLIFFNEKQSNGSKFSWQSGFPLPHAHTHTHTHFPSFPFVWPWDIFKDIEHIRRISQEKMW